MPSEFEANFEAAGRAELNEFFGTQVTYSDPNAAASVQLTGSFGNIDTTTEEDTQGGSLLVSRTTFMVSDNSQFEDGGIDEPSSDGSIDDGDRVWAVESWRGVRAGVQLRLIHYSQRQKGRRGYRGV